jgi:hypothetical protein
MAVSWNQPRHVNKIVPLWLDWAFIDCTERSSRMTGMIINHWLKMFQDLFGGFPRDYTVLDIETTGPDAAADLILNIGHVIVEDGQVVQQLDAFLDWTREGRVNQQWLINRMEDTRQAMASRGREYKMSYDLIRTRGEDPIGILQAYHSLLKEQQASKYAFVMHNGYNFDAPRLCNHFKRWLGLDLSFGPNEIWDTGMIEKASQLQSIPDRNDTMQSWSKRVGGIRAKGVMWALDAHCVPKYNFATRYNLDESEAHGAGYDAYVTHLLFEEFRQIASNYQAPAGTVATGTSHAPQEDDDTGGRYGHLG